MAVGVPFDQEAKDRFVSLIAQGKSPHTAAALIDVSFDSTVKKHLADDPAFFSAMTSAAAHASSRIEDVLYEEAEGGNLGAIKMWLYNRMSDRWRDETVLRKEISGPNGGPVQVVQANVMALREVLTDEDTRSAALEMVDSIAATGHELPAGEDGDPGASGADGHG